MKMLLLLICAIISSTANSQSLNLPELQAYLSMSVEEFTPKLAAKGFLQEKKNPNLGLEFRRKATTESIITRTVLNQKNISYTFTQYSHFLKLKAQVIKAGEFTAQETQDDIETEYYKSAIGMITISKNLKSKSYTLFISMDE
jgi:hypothetical protein